jgi:hypothetical protein
MNTHIQETWIHSTPARALLSGKLCEALNSAHLHLFGEIVLFARHPAQLCGVWLVTMAQPGRLIGESANRKRLEP